MYKAISVNFSIVEGEKSSFKFTVSGYNESDPEHELVLIEEHTEFEPFSEAFFDAVERVSTHAGLDKLLKA